MRIRKKKKNGKKEKMLILIVASVVTTYSRKINKAKLQIGSKNVDDEVFEWAWVR